MGHGLAPDWWRQKASLSYRLEASKRDFIVALKASAG
jgi:hypothetical protein